VSEVDVCGRVLSTFTDVSLPVNLSLDSEDHVLVADCYNHRIMLLNNKLQLRCVLVDTDSAVLLWKPKQLCYNEPTSQMYVVHSSNSNRQLPWSDVVTGVNLR